MPSSETNQPGGEGAQYTIKKHNIDSGFKFSEGKGLWLPEALVAAEIAEKWAEITYNRSSNFATFQKGIELGVPAELIEEHLRMVLDIDENKDNKMYEYRLRHNLKEKLGFGNDVDVHQAGVAGYEQAMEAMNFRSAAEIAIEVFGPESTEYISSAQQQIDLEAKQQAEFEAMEATANEGIPVVLSRDATFAMLEDDPHFNDDIFWSEMWDNLGQEIGHALLDLSSEERRATKVLDFFQRFGINEDFLSIDLPIEFEDDTPQKA